MTISKKTGLEIAFLVMSAFIIMTAVSASSPIYPLNVWDDVNVYFTVGRGVFEGQVPYMDLYEQKGPIFLLVYAVASLISKTSFTGVWLFECIAASVFAIFCWKTVKLFVPKAPAVCIGLVPVLMGITYTIGMFNFGGNTEEFCFPLLSVVLYVALKMIKEEKVLPGVKDSLVCGLIAGMLFWTKYTFLGFILGFILILIVRAVRNKAYKLLLKDILYFIAGFAVVSLPVFIYFGANHALGYLWEVYFYNNIFNYIGGGSYPGLLGNPVVRFLAVPVMALTESCMSNLDYCVLMILSLVGVVVFEKKYRKSVITLFLVTFAISLKAVFSQPFYTYYYGYILSFYFVFALILVVKGIEKLMKKRSYNKRLIQLVLGALCAVITMCSMFMCKNTYLMFVPKEELSQYVLADIINQTEDPKILTYDIIDGGFYLASGVSPSNRFFTTMNFIENNEEAVEEQERLIAEGYFDYIVTYSDEYEWDNYELIAEDIDPYCDFTKVPYLDRHCLYRRISD